MQLWFFSNVSVLLAKTTGKSNENQVKIDIKLFFLLTVYKNFYHFTYIVIVSITHHRKNSFAEISENVNRYRK